MDAVSPVLALLVTLVTTVAISANVVPSGERSMRNPDSLLAVSVQLRLIRLHVAAIAVKFVGAVGAGGPSVVALDGPTYLDVPAAVQARNRHAYCEHAASP